MYGTTNVQIKIIRKGGGTKVTFIKVLADSILLHKSGASVKRNKIRQGNETVGKCYQLRKTAQTLKLLYPGGVGGVKCIELQE